MDLKHEITTTNTIPNGSVNRENNSQAISANNEFCKRNSARISSKKMKNKRKTHIFKVEKSVESYEESEDLSFIEDQNKENLKRIGADSKVNFTKLNDTEKDIRLKSLANLVKRLRRKVKNLEKKFKYNTNKIINKYISHYLEKNLNNSNIFNFQKKNIKINMDINLDNLCKAFKILKESEILEYEDQKFAIENFINLIAEEKLPLDSIHFRKICTQLRLYMSNEKIIPININKGNNITLSFNEREVKISKNEYEYYSKFKDNEEVIRLILGIKPLGDNQIFPEKINYKSMGNKSYNMQIDVSNNNFPNNTVDSKTNSNDKLNNDNALEKENSDISNLQHFNNKNYETLNFIYNNYLSGAQNPNNNYNLFNPINGLNLNDILKLRLIENQNFQNKFLMKSIYVSLLQNFINNSSTINKSD